MSGISENYLDGHGNHLPVSLDRIANDPLVFAETVGALVDYSLVRRTDAGLQSKRSSVSPCLILLGDQHSLLPLGLGMLCADFPAQMTGVRRSDSPHDPDVTSSNHTPGITSRPPRRLGLFHLVLQGTRLRDTSSLKKCDCLFATLPSILHAPVKPNPRGVLPEHGAGQLRCKDRRRQDRGTSRV